MEQVQIAFHFFIRNESIKERTNQLPAWKKALIQVYSNLRSLVSQYMEDWKVGRYLGMTPPDNNEDDVIGVVEIDETLMTHHDGLQMWVLGIFDRVTRNFGVLVCQTELLKPLYPSSRNMLSLVAEFIQTVGPLIIHFSKEDLITL